MPKTIYHQFIKPIFDRLGSLLLLVVFAPLFLVISIVLFLLQYPVLFRQERPGLNGVSFVIYKFTSLDTSGVSFPFGRFLRKSSLDELPQLFNVLKGDMSFIGPRPLLVEYLNSYTPNQMRRHNVKPGITGLAQINGRKILSLADKVMFDLDYVEGVNLRLDLIIFLGTFVQLLKWGESDDSAKELEITSNET